MNLREPHDSGGWHSALGTPGSDPPAGPGAFVCEVCMFCPGTTASSPRKRLLGRTIQIVWSCLCFRVGPVAHAGLQSLKRRARKWMDHDIITSFYQDKVIKIYMIYHPYPGLRSSTVWEKTAMVQQDGLWFAWPSAVSGVWDPSSCPGASSAVSSAAWPALSSWAAACRQSRI